uniref:DNA-directed DNA polymerase n=1 Tax=candidate division WOR-3 bacterium TaxID=2052148 RepID=A0A7V3ZUS5_UNCW3
MVGSVDNFQKIIGHKEIITFLKKLKNMPFIHSLIFYGKKGIGKRTLALVFAQYLACLNKEKAPCGECPHCRMIGDLEYPYLEIIFPGWENVKTIKEEEKYESLLDLRSQHRLFEMRPETSKKESITIDVIREIKERIKMKADEYRIYLIIDAERMTQEAANAFLKTLEEPPERVFFILTTSQIHKLPATIRSRCYLLKFSSLEPKAIEEFLVKKGWPLDTAKKASAFSFGSLRTALQLINRGEKIFPEEVIKFAEIRKREVGYYFFRNFYEKYSETDYDTIVSFIKDLIFLYRGLLYQKLGYINLFEIDPHLKVIAERKTYEEIIISLYKLNQLYEECEYNLNKKLILFHLYSSLTDEKSFTYQSLDI